MPRRMTKGRAKTVAVITGGAGGMGLATARLLARDHHVVLSDLSAERLVTAVAGLAASGFTATSIVSDVRRPASVRALFERAGELGELASVVHTAGISPQMADAKTIIEVNALGTLNIVEACRERASDGFALVNVASMAAHLLPRALLPTALYPLARKNRAAFVAGALAPCRLMPKELYKRGLAYGISKSFVIWITRKSAAAFGQKGARIVSVSPGSFDTEMGRLEERSGSAKMLETAALRRFGRPEEIAEVLAFCASTKAGYLTGVDILCDGGVVAGRK
jgi:NAD(P)-dependent dehydrogenase (short-subunit alcohol dehydrogenase family)